MRLLEKEETELTETEKSNKFPMRRIKKDITDVVYGIICHQVNARGVMGAGLSAQIKGKFPTAFRDYKTAYDTGKLKLGNTVISKISENLYIAHIVGQHDYGRGQTFTNYQALTLALIQLKKFKLTLDEDLPVYFPWRMGCGLGGGSWRIVKDIIEENLSDAIICQL
jgi:O-acetyl-ADP-ribose deacetylase (regulator of RNase III)